MINKLQKLIDSRSSSFAINCTSEEEAQELLKALSEMGYCWNRGKPICNSSGDIINTFLGKSGESAYYFFQTFPWVYYGRKEFFKTINCEIIRFYDLKNDIIPLPYEEDEKVTYIEIFEDVAIENICSALAQTPKKIIFVGNNRNKMERACSTYRSLLKQRNADIEIEFKACKPEIPQIVKAFSKIIEKETRCCFDITGGYDIYLVALGAVLEKYRNRNVQVHMFDINEKTISDCDNDGIMPFKEFPRISVAENIAIYGGSLKSTSVQNQSEVKAEDLNALWEIMKRFKGSDWNHMSDALTYIASRYFKSEKPLEYEVPFSDRTESFNFLKLAKGAIIYELVHAKLITNFFIGSTVMRFKFKNEFIKRCVTCAGNLLELKIYSLALNAKKEDGKTPVFNDVQTGVEIEWNTRRKNGALSAKNEIDVLLMDGLIPVFISCKNGQVSIDELYKLNSVARNFGSKYSRKILITNKLKSSVGKDIFRQRARDMGIKLIENVESLDDETITGELINYGQIK